MRAFIQITILVLVLNTFPLLSPVVECLQKSPSSDDIVVSEKRFISLRKALPPLSVVGYVSDNEKTKGNLIGLVACRRFYMTQYALAPNIVVHDLKRPLIVGNFTSPKASGEAVETNGLEIVEDFGDGVMLLRKVQETP